MDGYPTEAEPALHPLDMTPAQRMLEMNRVGEEVDAGRHWSYEMRPGCVLRIDIDGEHGSFPSLDLPLLGAEVKINPDKEEGTFEVTIQRRDAPSEQVGHTMTSAPNALSASLFSFDCLSVVVNTHL